MNDFLTYMNDMLAQVQESFLADGGGFIAGARVVAALGTTIAAFFTFYKISNGEGESWKMFAVKLLAVYLGIGFYGTFLDIINAPLNIVSSAAKDIAQINDEGTENFFNDFHVEKKDAISNSEFDEEISERTERFKDENPEVSESVFGETLDLITSGGAAIDGFINDAMVSIRAYILEAFYNICKFLGMIAIIILNLIRTFFLIVLQIFGVFAIAFSIYPVLGNSFSQWLQKYINVYLWLPIGYILQGIINKLFSSLDLDTAMTPGSIAGDTSAYLDSAATNGAVAVIGLCSIVGFAAVPTMSSWLVNASTNGLASKLKGKTMESGKAVQKGMKSKASGAAAGAATGGAGTAAVAATKAMGS